MVLFLPSSFRVRTWERSREEEEEEEGYYPPSLSPFFASTQQYPHMGCREEGGRRTRAAFTHPVPSKEARREEAWSCHSTGFDTQSSWTMHVATIHAIILSLVETFWATVFNVRQFLPSPLLPPRDRYARTNLWETQKMQQRKASLEKGRKLWNLRCATKLQLQTRVKREGIFILKMCYPEIYFPADQN